MNRYIKLIFLLPILFVVSVNAKVYNLNDYIDGTKIYKSGDVLENVKLNDTYVYFRCQGSGEMVYSLYTFDTPDDEIEIDSNLHSLFYTYKEPETPEGLFDVIDGARSKLIIPKVFGEDALWVLESTDDDEFTYMMHVPKYNIECNGNKCSLYMAISGIDTKEFIDGVTTFDYILFSLSSVNFNFNLTSDDYTISNIVVNPNTGFSYKNKKVSGQLLNYEDISEYINMIKGIIPSEEAFIQTVNGIRNYYGNYGTFDSIHLADLVRRSNNTSINKKTYTIKVLDFEVEPNKALPTGGVVGINNFGIEFVEDEFNAISTEIDDVEPLKVSVVKEEVKGVEENPKTGLFNYLLLIIPVGLLGIGFKLLRRVNIFKKI